MEKRLDDAAKVLEAGMKLPGVKAPMTAAQRIKTAKGGIRLREPLLHERVSIYLLMAECLSKQSRLNDAPEATKIINDALHEFKVTDFGFPRLRSLSVAGVAPGVVAPQQKVFWGAANHFFRRLWLIQVPGGKRLVFPCDRVGCKEGVTTKGFQ